MAEVEGKMGRRALGHPRKLFGVACGFLWKGRCLHYQIEVVFFADQLRFLPRHDAVFEM